MASLRKCKHCQKRVVNPFVVNISAFCDLECAVEWGRSDRAKKIAAQTLKKENKKRREALKNHSDWVKEAQKSVNSYIRIRDKNNLCISCDKPLTKTKTGNVGGRFDAGHFIARGSGANGKGNALRFYVLNIFGQCKQCNQHRGGNYSEYRLRLAQRIGIDHVERLENLNAPRKWTLTELKKIKNVYQKKRLLYKRLFRT